MPPDKFSVLVTKRDFTGYGTKQRLDTAVLEALVPSRQIGIAVTFRRMGRVLELYVISYEGVRSQVCGTISVIWGTILV